MTLAVLHFMSLNSYTYYLIVLRRFDRIKSFLEHFSGAPTKSDILHTAPRRQYSIWSNYNFCQHLSYFCRHQWRSYWLFFNCNCNVFESAYVATDYTVVPPPICACANSNLTDAAFSSLSLFLSFHLSLCSLYPHRPLWKFSRRPYVTGGGFISRLSRPHTASCFYN